MNAPILTDEITAMFDSELIGFLAGRYNKSAPEIIRQFLIQYKQGTLHMVKDLRLLDQTELNPASHIINYIK